MKLYRIKDWNEHYENNRSRQVQDLTWVPMPNRHDGENFSAIMAHPRGAEIFAAWCLTLQVASRCQPRGSLLRGDGKPHDSASLARKTRGQQEWFDLALEFLTTETDWLVVEELADGRQAGDAEASGGCDKVTKNGMEWNGREQKERESGASIPPVDRETLWAQAKVVGVSAECFDWFWNLQESRDWIDPRSPAGNPQVIRKPLPLLQNAMKSFRAGAGAPAKATEKNGAKNPGQVSATTQAIAQENRRKELLREQGELNEQLEAVYATEGVGSAEYRELQARLREVARELAALGQ